MSSIHRGLLQGRRAAALVLGLFVVASLVLVFAGTSTRSTTIEAEAERLRAENRLLQERVAEGDRELAIYQTDAGKLWQARVLGYGEEGEKRIVLPANAPSPEPIVPLGARGNDEPPQAPLDAWLELLFGG